VKAYIDDPAVEVFGKHLSEHFDEFAKEFVTFRELRRIHKLVQVARWYQESGFPTERFFNEYKRLNVHTPGTTRRRETIVSEKTLPGPDAYSYYIMRQLLIGGVNLSPPNYYVPAPSVPSVNLTPGTVTHWQPNERFSMPTAVPVRYGSLSGPATVPAFAAPVFQSRPARASYGWTTTVGGKKFAVVSIPMSYEGSQQLTSQATKEEITITPIDVAGIQAMSDHGTITSGTPDHQKVAEAQANSIEAPLSEKTSQMDPWFEIGKHLAQTDDIDGAHYDEKNEQLTIWGPKRDEHNGASLPPLLIDDFAVAFRAIEAGNNISVSIGTLKGHPLAEREMKRAISLGEIPVEYQPNCIFGTHAASVMFEADHCLKNLAFGVDISTQSPVRSNVPGYRSLSDLLKSENPATPDDIQLIVLGLAPDETDLVVEGRTIKFYKLRMRVVSNTLNNPMVEHFCNTINDHFDEFSLEFPILREMSRLSKVFAVARWYKESGFPTERFLKENELMRITTPVTLPVMWIPLGKENSQSQGVLLGGIRFPSPIESFSHPSLVTKRTPEDDVFATEISPAITLHDSYGRTVTVGEKDFVVVSIPMCGSDL